MSAARNAVLNEAADDFFKSRISGDFKVRLELDVMQAVLLTGALQLALRHPGIQQQGIGSDLRQFIDTIKEQIPADCRGLRKLIELGFHPRFDT